MPLYVADFETVVDKEPEKQEETEVWAYGIAELFDGTEDVKIGNSIDDFFSYIRKGQRRTKNIIYFHNIKFDGSFILDYITRELGFKPAFDDVSHSFKKEKDIAEKEYTCVITDLGIWYNIIIKYDGYLIEFRDSYKLLPFSIEDLGPAFETKYRKLEMEYKGDMHKGCNITPEQQAYIRNDILVPKEALEKFFNEIKVYKNPPLTISQSALTNFKKNFSKDEWALYFPNLAEIELDENIYGSKTIDAYIRKSYMGGWCYVDERYTGIVNDYTKTYDVNSLYPSCMRDHNNPMPVGIPVMTKKQTDIANYPKDSYYFIRFKCEFDIKTGYFPFIQLKHDTHYRSNENLKTSRWDLWGNSLRGYKPTITLSKTLFLLFIQCYNIKDFEFLDMAIFNVEYGLFDSYVDHYMSMKEEAVRTKNKVKKNISKLYMNSLYGKFGRNPENSFKIPLYNEDNEIVDYIFDQGEDNKPVYIPIASAITSYARAFTVKAAIQNYEYFRYSDTDSVHLCCDPSYNPKGITLHESKLSCWKEECISEHSIFVRQKTYIEYTLNKENKQLSEYDIKGCGMSDRCKMLFEQNLKKNWPDGDILSIPVFDKDNNIIDYKMIKLSEKEIEFMSDPLSITDYHTGFSVPGNLKPKLIKGGTVLIEHNFTIR